MTTLSNTTGAKKNLANKSFKVINPLRSNSAYVS